MKLLKFNKNKMEKKEALKRLTSLENEAKELRKIIEAPDKPLNIMDRVKSVEDACNVIGKNYCIFLEEISSLDADEQAYRKLKVIIKALQGDWKADFTNENQKKYYPYFKIDKSFSSFCFASVDYSWAAWNIDSGSGSRLCLPTSELAYFMGNYYIDLYKDFMF